MKLKVFAINDRVAGYHHKPFFMLTTSEALRAFQNLANDETTDIGKNPNDYELVEIGVYDNVTAMIDIDRDSLGIAASFVNQEELDNA